MKSIALIAGIALFAALGYEIGEEKKEAHHEVIAQQDVAPLQQQQQAGAITSFQAAQWMPPGATGSYPVMYMFSGTVNAPNPERVMIHLRCRGKVFAVLGICTPSGSFSGAVYLRYGIDREYGPGETVTAVAFDQQNSVIGTRTAVVP
jgi:hypothetical protein